MNRIDIEGAIPLPPPKTGSHQQDGRDQDQKKQHFEYLLQSPYQSTPLKENLQNPLAPFKEQWADYRIVSGLLSGTVIRVSFAQQGFFVRLTCPDDKTKKRLSGVRKRWERELARMGIPCFLEVSDAIKSPP